MSNLNAAIEALKSQSKLQQLNAIFEPSKEIGTITITDPFSVSPTNYTNNPNITLNIQQGNPKIINPCSSCNKELYVDCFCDSNRHAIYNKAKASMKKVQEQIKLERKAKGWTQKELASKCRMSQGTITRAENNGWISITCLLMISNALGKEITLVNN